MTVEEAKRALILYRPGLSDPADEEFAEAVELARTHPQLGAWFEQHCAFQSAMRDKFRQLEIPPGLKTRLDESRKRTHQRRWQRSAPWMAAAAAVLLLALAVTLLGSRTPDRFADYVSRMVRSALVDYRMDRKTTNKVELREYLKSRGGPSDYVLSPKLENLRLTGGGFLLWRTNPVSMVCFDRGDTNMIFLFVMKRTAVKDSPPALPQLPQATRVKSMLTVSWAQGNNTYLLAGPAEPDFATKYR